MIVLGFAACHVTSKLCGIGPAERSWGGVKNVKTGKRSHMCGESTEKRSILYVSVKIQQSRILCDPLEKLDATGNNACLVMMISSAVWCGLWTRWL